MLKRLCASLVVVEFGEVKFSPNFRLLLAYVIQAGFPAYWPLLQSYDVNTHLIMYLEESMRRILSLGAMGDPKGDIGFGVTEEISAGRFWSSSSEYSDDAGRSL